MPKVTSVVSAATEKRFWSHCNKTPTCWFWTGSISGRGYGKLSIGGHGKSIAAHRMALLLHATPIPIGKLVDHVCRNRLCVNPAHLRVVDNKTNSTENSIGPTAINARKTSCIRGHSLTGDNVKIVVRPDGKRRHCRTCLRFHEKNRKPRRKPALAQKEKSDE